MLPQSLLCHPQSFIIFSKMFNLFLHWLLREVKCSQILLHSQVQEVVGNCSRFTYIQLSDTLHQTQGFKVLQTQTHGFKVLSMENYLLIITDSFISYFSQYTQLLVNVWGIFGQIIETMYLHLFLSSLGVTWQRSRSRIREKYSSVMVLGTRPSSLLLFW